MNQQLRWSMLIQWSDEDDAYLVSFPEWTDRINNPITHGSTYEEAVANGREALEMLVEHFVEQGRPLPTPSATVAA